MKSISPKWSIFAWALYDFSSTIFAMNIITLYFVLWVTIDMHGEDILYSFALSGSMLVAAIISPLLGSISDRIGKKMPFLIILTVVAFIFAATIGFAGSLAMGLIVFACANLFYQLGDVFYHALLPQVSATSSPGRVSGYGKTLGYFGAILGLVIAGPIAINYGRQYTFLPTAILFILFTIPCFFLVKDPPKVVRTKDGRNVIKAAAIEIKHTLVNIRQYADLTRILLAIFIGFNTVSTVVIFMSVYVEKVVGFTDADIQIFYIVSSVFAGVGSFIIGFLSDFFGAKRTLISVYLCWSLAIIMAASTTYKPVYWVIGPLVGIALGGVWTSARALLVEFCPPNMSGEVFGFFGLLVKLAAIIGPLVWGISVWAFSTFGLMRYRIAVLTQLIFLLFGILMLRKVPNRANKK